MFVVFVIFLIVGFTLIPTYMNSISTNSEVIQYGIDYLRIVVIGCFGMLFALYVICFVVTLVLWFVMTRDRI